MKSRIRRGQLALLGLSLPILAALVFLIIRHPVGTGIGSGTIAMLVLSLARVVHPTTPTPLNDGESR